MTKIKCTFNYWSTGFIQACKNSGGNFNTVIKIHCQSVELKLEKKIVRMKHYFLEAVLRNTDLFTNLNIQWALFIHGGSVSIEP